MRVPESVKAADEILLGLALGQGPFGDRRNDGKRILDAVAELGRQYLQLLLCRYDVGDIDKNRKHAIDRIVRRAVREDTGEVMGFAVTVAYCPLDHLAAEHRADILFEIRVVNAADE